jgi:hypothetical protein
MQVSLNTLLIGAGVVIVNIQSQPQRHTVIDKQSLMKLLDISHYKQLQQHHKGRVEDMPLSPNRARDPLWSNSIAVCSREYVSRVKNALGISAKYKQTTEANGLFLLREILTPYT